MITILKKCKINIKNHPLLSQRKKGSFFARFYLHRTKVDLNKLVLETDAPYLAPSPKRGKRNESSYLVYVAQKLAEIYQVPIKEIAEITTVNSRKLFQI